MRVLYIHQHFSTRSGATGTRSYEMARRLVARGHEVTVICGAYSMADTGTPCSGKALNRSQVDGIDVLQLSLPYANRDGFYRRAKTFLFFSLAATFLALRERYDILVATSTPLSVGIPAIVAKLLRRKPYVFEVRDLWPELPKVMGIITNPVLLGGLRLLEWLAYHLAEHCIALAPGIRDGIASRSIPSERITLIPNGGDVDLFTPPAGLGAFPGGAAGAKVAIFAGAHGRANGLGALLDAAAILQRRAADINIVMVGDGAERPGLIARAAREGLTNCLFLAPTPKVELARLLARAQVGLMILEDIPAFYYGTSPNKFFDYIAAGLPVVTNYPGWIAEMIAAHGCGIAVPPCDPAALADAIVAVTRSGDGWAAMSANSRQLAQTQFDRDQLGQAWIAVIEAAAARHR